MPAPSSSLPPVLLPVVAHAERFAELLDARERHLSTRDPAALWLMGRGGEVRCLAAALCDDVERARLSAGQAAIDLALHLQALHDGVARVAGRQTLACCIEAADPSATVLLRDLTSASHPWDEP